MPLFRLAHISDPHLPPPPGALGLRDLASKRALSALAWRRKGLQHQPAILAALVDDVAAYGPDHTVVTGDLTNYGTMVEFDAARRWLQGLGAAADVTVSPGNHDALVGSGAHARFAAWGDWLGDEAGEFPKVRRRGPLALVNLCSGRANAPLLASGRLGGDQLARLDSILAGLADERAFRVLALHHPPLKGVVSWRKALEDGAALRRLLRARGVDLVLHGHAHEAAVGVLDGPDGAIPVFGAPSASAAPGGAHPAARWHGLEIDDAGAAPTVRIVARGFSAETGLFEPLGSYVLASPRRR